ncbi:MAG: MerR family transcriptional regulator [Flavobacteriales bacterium TMED113]|nr:MAG: MerR family transcriptional regulator [Flavobacteriales bacterium TMED113]|tara:strand:+ start:225 stop:560 length:336 start_codon:yes stop_codon:yes gene_type:complete
MEKKNKLKLYYSIGEISNITGISASKIRFWEKEFEILNPQKNKKGNRRFTLEDLKKIKLIYHLLKEKKYTIRGAKNKLQNNFEEIEKNLELTERLNRIKKELIEIRENLKN